MYGCYTKFFSLCISSPDRSNEIGCEDNGSSNTNSEKSNLDSNNETYDESDSSYV